MRTNGLSRLGVLLCLTSGIAFAVQPILGSLALDRGADIVSMLGWRYLIAALALAVVARRSLRTMPLRIVLAAFGLGLVLYTADSFLFYTAVERTSAPFAALLHYAHLVIVVGAAAFLGRERLSAKPIAALAFILLGIALVGGGAVSVDTAGLAIALASAGVYSIYILASDRLLRDVDPVAYSTVLTAGAATSFLTIGFLRGDLSDLGGTPGVAIVVVAALVGSAFALTAFLAGIRLVGPGTASLLVTIEVPIGLTLAGIVLGDRLATPQLTGAALVVGAIVLLQVPDALVGRLSAAFSGARGGMLDPRDAPVPIAAGPNLG
ncbi:MAG: DMT family transporter [Gaiellales bacterium]